MKMRKTHILDAYGRKGTISKVFIRRNRYLGFSMATMSCLWEVDIKTGFNKQGFYGGKNLRMKMWSVLGTDRMAGLAY
jgi:hypothetical protein